MTSLGAFEIGRVLGTGGSGTVYAARVAGSGGAELALKVLREDAAVTERERARFMEEAGLMRRVSHPALVGLLDAGFLPDGRPYVAMPLLAGESLAARLARGPLPLHEALVLFDDLAGALSALHAAGLVHRDIKPENVLVGERGGRAAATLLDLGIARDVLAPAGTTTKLGNVRGTPAYMALERFFGTPASVLSDVYELTVTLYVMLTGTLPWRRPEDATERMAPMHPAEAGARLPEALVAALSRGLAAKPEARFASVTELARAITSSAAGVMYDTAVAPTAALLPPRASFAPPAAPSDPHAFASTTLAPQYPPAGALYSLPPSATPPPQPAASGASSTKGAALIAGGIFVGLVLVGAMIAGAVLFSRRPADTSLTTAVSAAPLAAPQPSASPAPAVSASNAGDAGAAGAFTSPRPHGPAPTAKPSAAPSATTPAAATQPNDLWACDGEQGIYCGPDYQHMTSNPAKCTAFMNQVLEYRKRPPEARAAKNKECLGEKLALEHQIDGWKSHQR